MFYGNDATSILPSYAPVSGTRSIVADFTPVQDPRPGMGKIMQAMSAPGMAGLGMLANPCSTGACGAAPDLRQPEVVEETVYYDDGAMQSSPGVPLTGAAIAVGAVVGIGVLALGGYLSYQAGKAMSPPGQNWGLAGVPGMFFGVPWFGVMGMISNAQTGK